MTRRFDVRFPDYRGRVSTPGSRTPSRVSARFVTADGSTPPISKSPRPRRVHDASLQTRTPVTDTSTITPLSDHAVVVNSAQDNVAIVKYGVPAGLRIRMPDGRELTLAGAVGPGHRFATTDVPAGTLVRQYGQPIGTSRGIKAGDPITVQNMSNDVPVVRELAADLRLAPPDYLPEAQRRTFRGFRRADGRVGSRNFILVVPTSMCASHESQQIAMM